MYSLTFQFQSQLQISRFIEITKPSIFLNLNYQLIYFIKYIHCITKESNNQNRKQKNFFFLGLAWAKI